MYIPIHYVLLLDVVSSDFSFTISANSTLIAIKVAIRDKENNTLA